MPILSHFLHLSSFGWKISLFLLFVLQFIVDSCSVYISAVNVIAGIFYFQNMFYGKYQSVVHFSIGSLNRYFGIVLISNVA